MAKKKDPQAEASAGRQITNEEQMKLRQSAPKPDPVDELAKQQMMNAPMADPQMMAQMPMNGAMDGMKALTNPIGKKQLHKATLTLQKYKEGKENLEQRIVQNEQWYKLRHWESMRSKMPNQVEPTSGWLFNCIANKHADAMDSFPSPNVLPREESDEPDATMLSSIIPVILDQNDFEKTYSDVMNYKIKSGTGVYGVFWDAGKLNGLGDISIQKADILNLFWQSGITDIQKSRNLFHVDLADNEVLIRQYPQLQGKLGTQTINVAKYVYDDNVDTTDKSVVVDWYYKKANSKGKQILHYCKYVNDEVLFATENDPNFAERGFYDHGNYPFVFDVLFPTEGTPTGFGYIDVGKSSQEYIDRGNQAIMQNMLANAKPRHFIRSDGSVNEAEYADMTKDFIHVDGALGTDSIMPVQGKPLNTVYVNVIHDKVDELKETTGNRDISTGGSAAGVTAASAIAALQESGSKLSRDSNKASYRAFRQLVLMMIELIRQFYDLPRCFRIVGEGGMRKFVQYSNAGIVPQSQGEAFGIKLGERIPLFDVEVTAEKQSPYSKMAQNELALQFYGAGFFDPMRADQALACLEMMDFDRKDAIMQRIQMNGGMMQQMMMLAQMVDSMRGGNEISAGVAQQFGIPMPQGGAQMPQGDQSVTGGSGQEASITKKARERVAEATAPR